MDKLAGFFRWMILASLLSMCQMGWTQIDRIQQLEQLLDSMSQYIPALEETSSLSMRAVSVAEYIRAIGLEHEINLYIPETPTLQITSNLVNEPVKSVFLFVCKRYDFSIEPTGTILEFFPYVAPPEPEPTIAAELPLAITYSNGLLSVDLRNDSLYKVVRTISTLTGQKIVFPPGTKSLLTSFLPPTPLDTALEAIFLANGFRLQPKRKGYYVLVSTQSPAGPPGGTKPQQGRLDFVIEAYTDGIDEYLQIDAEDADLNALVKTMFQQLEIDYLLYDQLQGTISIQADVTRLDDMLNYLLQGTPYTYKKQDNLYLVGEKGLEGLQTTRIVKLQYRPTQQAVDLIPGVETTSTTSQTPTLSSSQGNNNSSRQFNNNGGRSPGNNFQNQPGYSSFSNGNSPFSLGFDGGSFESSPPPVIVKSKAGAVEIVEYPELNRIILKGPTDEVAGIVDFLTEIDRPVPMVKVELIVVEVNKDRLLSTGLRAGLRTSGDSVSGTKAILPGVDYTLDGAEINAILGSIPGLSNLGTLSSNFYLQLKAQESRGNLKVRMNPVLSTLNGREASLTIGQTQYYLLETQTASTGAVNNFQTFTQRFERIEANITLTIKPYISDDGMVTLDVIPNFTTPIGQFDASVPPTIATRRFVSTIRVKDGQTVILGGLNQEMAQENTSGLPWLSRVPVLKWFFGNVNKNRSEASLLIYITPVISYN